MEVFVATYGTDDYGDSVTILGVASTYEKAEEMTEGYRDPNIETWVLDEMPIKPERRILKTVNPKDRFYLSSEFIEFLLKYNVESSRMPLLSTIPSGKQ
jgi:hypothetical protein